MFDGEDAFGGGDDDVADGEGEGRELASGFENFQRLREVVVIEGVFGGGEDFAVGFGFFVGKVRAG